MAIAYYNENNPYCVAWLRNLITAGLIAPGDVDDRSIADVCANDLRGYAQCHFFAGIGGWSYALRIAGWKDDRPAWTCSCPCQPLSVNGLRKAHADKRHLWPTFQRILSQCNPTTVFGEQVAGADGEEWLSAARYDLEQCGYACGCANLRAKEFGAPHLRERLYWVANAEVFSRVHKPHRGEEKKRLSNDISYWKTSPWDETESKVYSLDDGLPSAVGIFHGLGNAIVPQVAADFIAAYMECQP